MSFSPFQPTLTSKGQSAFGLDVALHKPDTRLATEVFAFVNVTIRHATVYPIVPDATNMLLFSKCQQSFGGTQPSILEVPLTLVHGEYFGIWFYPGAMRRFFDVDIAESTGLVTDLDFLAGRKWATLGEQIYVHDQVEDRINLCERALMRQRLDTPLPCQFSAALEALYQSYGQCSVTSLAEHVGWSQRHLNRQFTLHTGLSVKAIAQTIRLNEYLKRCYQGALRPLDNGLDLGFYDHSHLIKTLKHHQFARLSDKAKCGMSSFYNSSS